MKAFGRLEWDPSECQRELAKFRRLLGSVNALRERDEILPFFQKNLHLSAFIGIKTTEIDHYDLVAFEYDLFGDFSCDLVVGDSRRKAYCFIEFEDASPNSIFSKKTTKSSPEWASRFEHGFSQIVDWFYKLADMEKTDEFEAKFGKRTIDYIGLLVVGRTESLGPREASRFRWRQEKTLVNSNKIHCVTFDQLYENLKVRLEEIMRVAGLVSSRKK